MFQRKIFPSLKAHLNQKQITVITGMRRTGKTTLVKELIKSINSKNKLYIDLERLDNRQLFEEKNYENTLLALKQRGLNLKEKIYLALDEIQLAKNTPSVVKYLYDNFDIKFIITGSVSYYLKNLFSESLAGRKKIFELWPLDFGEFLVFKKVSFEEKNLLSSKFSLNEYERIKFFYEEFIKFGGFPEVVLETQEENKKDMLNDIISSYFNSDLKNLFDIKKSSDVYNLIKLIAARAGSRLETLKLANITGLSRITVRNYIELFEKTYLIKPIPIFTNNTEKEIVKAKKIYFSDTGLLNILADTSGGAQFENALLNQLSVFGEISYYARRGGKEIDYIINKEIACEAKESPTIHDKNNLLKMAEKIGLKKNLLIGRYPVADFGEYLWGGDIK